MKYKWEPLPRPLNCFTVRGTSTKDLTTGEVIQSYAANTKIQVVQKCVTPTKTYYRTAHAVKNCLDWAFEASAFGLPDEIAPSVHCSSLVNAKKRSALHEGLCQKNKKDIKSARPDANDGGRKGLLSRVRQKIRRAFKV